VENPRGCQFGDIGRVDLVDVLKPLLEKPSLWYRQSRFSWWSRRSRFSWANNGWMLKAQQSNAMAYFDIDIGKLN
jgi:hypothetical protein